MNIAFIGPGVMPIPPDGWGAVEMMIWDYATIMGDLGHTGAIINTPDRNEIINELMQDKFDVVHLHYDVFHDIIPIILETIDTKLIVSSHYPYINNPSMWNRDNYHPIMNSYARNDNFYIFASSQNDINTFINHGAKEENCWMSRLGVLSSSYKFDQNHTYEKTLCFSQICDRKRQYLIQDFDDVDFVGRIEYGKFNNRKNYKGEYTRDTLNSEITKYGNFTLLSSIENTTPLAVKEALVCGLGVVVSEAVSLELDCTQKFIDVIPENKINDLSFLHDVIKSNREYSISHREEIKQYGDNVFGLQSIIENEYIPKLESLL
jgi:hypothetical protein